MEVSAPPAGMHVAQGGVSWSTGAVAHRAGSSKQTAPGLSAGHTGIDVREQF